MSPIYIVLGLVYIVACFGLMAIILLQKKKSAGMGGSVAGMGNADTYWDKNKGNTMEGKLENWTKIGAFLLAVLTIVLCLV